MTAPRIPRTRPALIPVGSRLRWTELPPFVRIAIGVALGMLALAALGSVA